MLTRPRLTLQAKKRAVIGRQIWRMDMASGLGACLQRISSAEPSMALGSGPHGELWFGRETRKRPGVFDAPDGRRYSGGGGSSGGWEIRKGGITTL